MEKRINVFVNSLKNYGETTDTELLMPSLLVESPPSFFNSAFENTSFIPQKILRISRRLIVSRFHRFGVYLPTSTNVLIYPWQLDGITHFYASYVDPFFLRRPPSLSTILRYNFQSDRVLFSRGVRDRKNHDELLRVRLSKYDYIHVSTDFGRERIVADLGVPQHRVCSCPYWLPYLSVIDREGLNMKLDNPFRQILFVGRDGKRKGFDTLIAAAYRTPESLRNRLRFITVSEATPPVGVFRDFNWEHFTSLPREDVTRLMRESHVFVLPTRSEAYGIVFVEAMASGCAIISDDDDVRRELVEQNGAGYCVPPDDPKMLSDALVELVSNDSLLQHTMEFGRLAAECKFVTKKVEEMLRPMFSAR